MSNPTPDLAPVTAAVTSCELTEKQRAQWRDTMTMLGWKAPGFRHIFYKLLDNNKGEYTAVMSRAQSIAATDAKNIIINPDNFFKFTLPERVFITAHEIVHNMYDDVGLLHRCHVSGEVPMSDGTRLPFDNQTMQHAMDLRIDCLLIQSNIGKPPQISLDRTEGLDIEKTANSSVIEQYKRLYKKKPDQEEGDDGEGGAAEEKASMNCCHPVLRLAKSLRRLLPNAVSNSGRLRLLLLRYLKR